MTNSLTKENLNELKEKLWKKILILEEQLEKADQKSPEYRRALDSYHKLVKSYLDIVKVQHYAPGLNSEIVVNDVLTDLFTKVRAGESLDPEEKKTLMQFKEFLRFGDTESPPAVSENSEL